MKFLPTLAGFFIATVSAVDLYYHGHNACSTRDPWVRCSNFNPDTCCRYDNGPTYQGSIAVRGIVQGWHIQLRAYTGGACQNLESITGNGNAQHICKSGLYSGQGYNFVGKKRAEPDAGTAATGSSSECQRPDTLGLPDGTEFNLVGLDDEDYNTM
jgi:hypothetical protein